MTLPKHCQDNDSRLASLEQSAMTRDDCEHLREAAKGYRKWAVGTAIAIMAITAGFWRDSSSEQRETRDIVHRTDGRMEEIAKSVSEIRSMLIRQSCLDEKIDDTWYIAETKQETPHAGGWE